MENDGCFWFGEAAEKASAVMSDRSARMESILSRISTDTTTSGTKTPEQRQECQNIMSETLHHNKEMPGSSDEVCFDGSGLPYSSRTTMPDYTTSPETLRESAKQKDHVESDSVESDLVCPQEMLPSYWETVVPDTVPLLTDDETELLRYYFTVVCDINSCFDSMQNPFRSNILNLLPGCAVLYHSILSMSAAHLYGWKLSTAPKAVEHQSQALKSLKMEVYELERKEKSYATLTSSRSSMEVPALQASQAPSNAVGNILFASIILGMTSVGESHTWLFDFFLLTDC